MRFLRSRALFAAALLPMLILALTGSGCIAGDANGSEEPSEESAPRSPQECEVAAAPVEEFRIDLNDDGISDFIGESVYQGTDGGPNGVGTIGVESSVCPDRFNEIVASQENWAAPLPKGAKIGSDLPDSLQWLNAKVGLYGRWLKPGRSPHDGPWADMPEGYLGLKVVSGEEARYGWARLRVDTSRSPTNLITVEDYALAAEPGEPIRTGEQP
jgi:hypothetical protein